MGEGAACLAARLPSLRTLLITHTARLEYYDFSDFSDRVPERCLLAFAAKWAELKALRQREGGRLTTVQKLELYHCDVTPAVATAMLQAQRECTAMLGQCGVHECWAGLATGMSHSVKCTLLCSSSVTPNCSICAGAHSNLSPKVTV